MPQSATRFPGDLMKLCWKCDKRGHLFWSPTGGEKVWCCEANKYREIGYQGECNK